MRKMQYALKFSTQDQFTYKGTERKDYRDKNGVVQPGYKNKFVVHHFALLALFQWGNENTSAKKEMHKKHKLRFTTTETSFEHEVQTLVAMMHWDTFNKSFKSTGQDSKKYFSGSKNLGKNLLKIQEDILNKVLELRRPWREHQMAKTAIRHQKCKEVSNKFVKTLIFNACYLHIPIIYCDEGPTGDKGPPSFFAKWGRRLGLTKI